MKAFGFLLALFPILLGNCTARIDNPPEILPADKDEYYSASVFSGIYDIPYRYVKIEEKVGGRSILVVLLHGGSMVGSDNRVQLAAAALDSLEKYLRGNSIKSVLVAPQCTQSAWPKVADDLRIMLDDLSEQFGADKIYIFGFSMGGTGVWNMLDRNPGCFAAAGIASGNPIGVSVDNVKSTPVYAIGGSEDRVVRYESCETFVKELSETGGEYRFDLLNGADHKTVCNTAFTTERINWILSH